MTIAPMGATNIPNPYIETIICKNETKWFFLGISKPCISSLSIFSIFMNILVTEGLQQASRDSFSRHPISQTINVV